MTKRSEFDTENSNRRTVSQFLLIDGSTLLDKSHYIQLNNHLRSNPSHHHWVSPTEKWMMTMRTKWAGKEDEKTMNPKNEWENYEHFWLKMA